MISVFDWMEQLTALPPQVLLLIGLGGGMLLLIWFATSKSGGGSLNIKSKVVGDGQHGTPAGPHRKKSQRLIHGFCSRFRSGGRERTCPRCRD